MREQSNVRHIGCTKPFVGPASRPTPWPVVDAVAWLKVHAIPGTYRIETSNPDRPVVCVRVARGTP